MAYLEEARANDSIRQSGRAGIDGVDAVLPLMRDAVGREPTEDRVAQHLVFVWMLAQESVGDAAVRVRKPSQVRSSCHGLDRQGMGP